MARRNKLEMTLADKKEKCIAEYRTGEWTQRELAYRNQIALGLVANITKEYKKDLGGNVNTQVQAAVDFDGLTPQNQEAVKAVAEKHIRALELDTYLDNVLVVAAKRCRKIIEAKDSTMSDIEKFGRFQNDARVGLKTQAKHANTNINVEQNQAQAVVIDPEEYTRIRSSMLANDDC